MPHTDVIRFYAKVSQDADLQDKLTSMETVEAVIKTAAEHGFVFSAEEFTEMLSTPVDSAKAVGRAAVPYDCTAATAWQGHPPDPNGCLVAWGCGVQHPNYGGPHIPLCGTEPF